MGSPRNDYGYDYSKYCMPQLRRVLGLENDLVRFDAFKHDLKSMVLEYLDQSKSPREQAPTVDRLVRKLKVNYPEFFGGEDSDRNIFYADKALRWIHCNERKTKKRRLRRAQAVIASPTTDETEAAVLPQPVQENESSPPGPTRSSRVDTSPRQPLTASRTLESVGSTQSFCSGAGNLSPETGRLPVTNSRPEAELGIRNRHFLPLTPVSVQRVRRNGGATKNPSEFARPSLQAMRTLNTPALPSPRDNSYITPTVSGGQFDLPPESPSISRGRPDAESSPLSPQLYTESGVKSVHKFLLSCKPPMDHFLSRFINFGWRNTDFLYAISAWSDSYRNQMLRKALAHETNGRDATEAEIAVLDYHLMQYGFVGKENMEVCMKI